MSDECPLALRQVDQARSDFYAISDDLEFVKFQLARLPTRKDLARTALIITIASAGLVILWLEAVWRHFA